MASIALLSNVTVGFLAQELGREHEVYVPAGYDTWRIELCILDSFLNTQEHDAEFYLLYADALADKWDSLKQGISEMNKIGEMLASHAEEKSGTAIFVSTLDFCSRRITDGHTAALENNWEIVWYQIIEKISETHPNVYIYDWNVTIHAIGRERFYSEKMWYMGSMPFSVSAIKEIAKDINIRIQGVSKNRKKCLAVDLDNTLWGGIAGEDGLDGILLSDHNQGKLYQDFQKRIKEIKELGTILVILSKNRFDDIEAIISNHPHMVLSWEDFSGYRINWDDKAVNLQNLASELNIGLDSIVFIDDNPAERDAMRCLCPEVEVPEFPKDVSKLPLWAEALYQNYFFALRVTGEDKRKTQMYQEEKKRNEMKKKVGSVKEYLDALQIEIEIHRLRKEEIDRVSQLTMKTNQFNLTTKRYSSQQIEEIYLDDNYDIFTIHTRDRFGDNGLVSVLICEKENRDVRIDTFLMSCRVMGRTIEVAVMDKIIEYYRRKFDRLVGTYVKTAKNEPVASLYTKLGFETKDEQTFIYHLEQNREETRLIRAVCFDGEAR